MRILITGASGFVGSRLALRLMREHTILGLAHRSLRVLPFSSKNVDLCDDFAVSSLMRSFEPDVIVHSAALSKVAECEDFPDRAREINVAATARLVRWAKRLNAKLIYLSSDQVFDGTKGGYRESDAPHPVSQYGLTKLEAERVIFASEIRAVVVRSNSVVGPARGCGESFTDWILNALQESRNLSLYKDQYRSPIHIRSLTDILTEACIGEFSGLIHAGGPHRMSRLDLGYAVARAWGLSPDPIIADSFKSHRHADVMTADTSYDIAHLRQVIPALKQCPLDEEFLRDAQEKESAA